MGVKVEDPVLLDLEVGVGRRLPGLVVREADAALMEDAPQLAAADGWHDLPFDEVCTQLGQAPARERLTPVDRAGEGHLHDLRAGVEIDPARTALAPPRVQSCEALRPWFRAELTSGPTGIASSRSLRLDRRPWAPVSDERPVRRVIFDRAGRAGV